jgi:hypothetical protein
MPDDVEKLRRLGVFPLAQEVPLHQGVFS